MEQRIIQEAVKLWQQEPDKVKGSSAVTATTDGAQANIAAIPFSWRTDLPAPFGRQERGARESPRLLPVHSFWLLASWTC